VDTPKRYRSLDAWRGLLCLRVVAYHATAAVGTPLIATGTWLGAIGVPLFFVISGFCIGAACTKADGGLAFFTKRIRRIYPAYWAALAILLVFISAAPDVWGLSQLRDLTPSQWLGNMTLTETWRPHVGGDSGRLILVQAWTLCYEEQFYVVTGLALLLGRKWFLPSIAVVTLGVIATMLLRLGSPMTGYFFDGTWLLFAEGVALSWLVSQRRRVQYAAAAALSAVALYTVITESPAWWHFNAFAVGPAFTVLLLGLYRWDDVIVQFRWVRPFTYCGTMCYSMYLIHPVVTMTVTSMLIEAGRRDWQTTLLVAVPLSIGGSVIVSRIFHVLIERRFMTERRQAPRSQSEKNPALVPSLVR
jgi:peptidoglycan/LPS O-acetylase OafA/YrhL